MCFFGVTWIRISDPRSLILCCNKGADESTLVTDSSAPVIMMHRDPSDLGLLILIRNAHEPDDGLIGEPRVGREGGCRILATIE